MSDTAIARTSGSGDLGLSETTRFNTVDLVNQQDHNKLFIICCRTKPCTQCKRRQNYTKMSLVLGSDMIH